MIPDPAHPSPLPLPTDLPQSYDEDPSRVSVERNAYRRAVDALARDKFAREGLPFSEQDLQRWANDENESDCLTLDQFIDELEKPSEGSTSP